MARITSRDLLSLDEGRRSLQRARFHFDTLARSLLLRTGEEANISDLNSLVSAIDAVIDQEKPVADSLATQEKESRRTERRPRR